MKTIIIIQARMGSSRLPGKVLMPLEKHPVLRYVVERCRMVADVDDVIVATSTLPGDDRIADWCVANNVSYFRGSEDDVLARYYECACSFSPDYVIRVTADCPFVDYEMASEIVRTMKRMPSDIVLVQGELPRGLVVEMISFRALRHIYEHGHEPRHREHVTYYAYESPHDFSATTYDAPANRRYPELRITLDTEEDYALCQAVAEHFNGEVGVSAAEVVSYLNEHPKVAAINAHIEQKLII
ncbi:glycosyltransferase family protein [Paenibacillus sp. MER TA 81-3]|uniref:cytidylyltransferase domain-containing protein n=1 Tax=Paenibacillus sp. MER TA 81-3 TaxID=2939573 RepID=UPI00203DBA21|nr:glycosyltransferase family protein [Paenibacillus sp. MER TA 81-3]MCM3338751.1 glycosyltransferase family protein [Paenibacillus sp. MER TA 81-3]